MNPPRSLYSRLVKRLLDLGASAVLMILLAPLMLVTWMAVPQSLAQKPSA